MAWVEKIVGWVMIGAVVMAGPAALPVASAQSSRTRTLAMITWRGQTEAERGFLDGLDRKIHAVSIETYHAAQSVENLYQIIRRIQQKPVDLIYVFGTTATQIVLAQVKTTPVVFNVVSLPVATGIIDSWKKSGRNAVGVSNQVPVHQQLKAFINTCAFKRLGIIFNPLEQNSLALKGQVERLSDTFGFSVHGFPIARKTDIQRKLNGLRGRVDAVYIPADSLIKSLGCEIGTQLKTQNIPSMSAVESMVPDDGILLGLVPSYYELGLAAAQKANRVLAGEPPGNIPSATLDHFQFWVNMRTAETIGIQIPLSTLIMADRIVR
ncbi:ABC transporter, substrate-binding protein [Desulfosarcina variabilis str. Montpellier]|uniref:ABC transporter substrate-binding protein n=1 Tax=Desulfosarcina variabilis TaxID=2300 RepID=UPI003AFA5E75